MMRDVDCCVSMKFRYLKSKMCCCGFLVSSSTRVSSWIIKFYGDFFFLFLSPAGLIAELTEYRRRWLFSVKNSQKRNAEYQSNYQNRQSLFLCFIKWITRHSWNLRCVIASERCEESLKPIAWISNQRSLCCVIRPNVHHKNLPFRIFLNGRRCSNPTEDNSKLFIDEWMPWQRIRSRHDLPSGPMKRSPRPLRIHHH